MFSIMPRSLGWILRAAGSSCTGKTLGYLPARELGIRALDSRPTCLLDRSRMRCALARELVHVMLGIEHELVSDEQPQTMLTGWLVQQAQ